MTTKASLALLALVVGAVPLSAQIDTRGRARDRVIYGDGRTDTRTGGSIGDIIFGRTSTETRTSTKVPKGHLPPRGMCRVWVDGVAPGQQPPVTSCAQAERDRLTYGANARVIYGDQQSFPGKGKGKFKNARNSGTVAAIDRRGGVLDRRVGDDDDFEDDDRFERSGKSGKSQKAAKRGKGKGRNKG